jgi:DNA-binding transcriptional regulator GbsR (MarR family)
MADALSEIQKRFVAEMGNIYAAYGFKRLNGLIVGMLLTRDEALSLDEMTELLGRSKGPLSEACRQLASAGLIRKVHGPENRRDYYASDPDIFLNNYKANMRTVRKNRVVAEQFLSEIRKEHDPSLKAMRAHLKQMHAFYTLMESFYASFSAEWEKHKME